MTSCLFIIGLIVLMLSIATKDDKRIVVRKKHLGLLDSSKMRLLFRK